MIIATLVMNMVTMMVLALVSSMQPLTKTKESGSEFSLPVKWQGSAAPVVRVREIRSVVLFGSSISSSREFNHLTAMLMGIVVTVAVTLSPSSSFLFSASR